MPKQYIGAGFGRLLSLLAFVIALVTWMPQAQATAGIALQGWQVATMVMFAAETTHVDGCQILVTALDQHTYADSSQPALITLLAASGANDSIVLSPNETLSATEISTAESGSARTISNSDDTFEIEKNSEIFFIHVGTVQCGKRL